MSILIEKLNITIGGVNYDSQYIYSNIRINQELMRPNELRFHMTKSTLVEDESDLKIDISGSMLGKEIQLSMTTFRDDESKSGDNDALKFSGIVSGVKAVRKQMGSELILEVSAYSHDYLLQNNAHCNSYENTGLAAIVPDEISQCGNIPLSVQPMMTEDIPYVVQYNETSYEFLSRLAQRYGEWFYNDGSQLIFGQLAKKEKVDLVPGFDIINYEYEMGVSHTKITHAHHNYLDYQNTQAASPAEGGSHRLASIASGASDSIYQRTTFRNYHSSLAEENSLDEVEYSSKALAKGKQAGTMICRGSSNRCDLQIGSIIRIKEYYDPGTGEEQEYTHEELLITGISHYAANDGSYYNEFVAIDPSSEHPPYAFGDCYPHTETQRGVVKDNKDPEHLGRVRVQFLWQQEQDDSQLTPWIRIAQPHGGGDKGFYFIPEMEEEVMVGFENGNAEKPYVIGTLYHGQAKPSDNWYNEEDDIKAIRTRSGHTLEFHDTGGNEFIKIYDNQKDNFILTFSTVEKLIKLQSKGNIELYADKDIIIDAKENIKINAGIDIDEKAGSNISETAGKNFSQTVGDNNTIEIGKDRTITVGNNISEKAGDNNVIEIGKDRTITVGNNISEKAGDNNTIEIGKDRTITVGSNISETAAADITIKAEGNISESAEKDISENAGGNVQVNAGGNIKSEAGNDIASGAGNDVSLSAKNTFSGSAGKDIGLSAQNDMSASAKNIDAVAKEDMNISAHQNYELGVRKKITIKGNSIEQTSNNDTKIVSGGKLEQKASSSMKITASGKLDVSGSPAKVN